MSKCVRSKIDGLVRRVGEEEAAKLVATKRWEYCSKSEWKAFKAIVSAKAAKA